MNSKFMKKLFILILTGWVSFSACSESNDTPGNPKPEPPVAENTELSMVDKNATAETKALYANLWEIQQKGFMFGHHDDLFYGRKWYDVSGNSDTKDVCGDYPGVFSLDFAEIMDDRHEENKANAIRKRCILEARRRGEVIIACCHLNNPLTGGDSWDNSNHHVVSEILKEGSEVQNKFKTWLDRLAIFTRELKDDEGKPIPIIFRPFHEHTQTWSWWGANCTTTTEFIALWKFTVNYLRDTKNIHQFIYAISPQMDTVKTEDDFLFRWPGDNYVDFIGMDCYHGLNPTTFSYNLKAISDLSQKKRKPCGVTETGVEGFTAQDYWSKQILTPATGRKISMIVMWRNKFIGGNDQDMHYFSIFKGHTSEADFMRFYNNELTFFSKDLPNMYLMPNHITIK